MAGNSGKTACDVGEARPRRAARGPDLAELDQSLERLRDSLLQRIERIEAIAIEQAALLDQKSSDRERVLRERVAVLETSQSRLQAESKRREQEWQATLEQLEDDRRLLAEAWQRIEHERLEAPAPHPQVQRLVAGDPGAPQPAAPVRPAAESARPAAGGDGDDPVARAILWQFQALKSDVRRNAKYREERRQ
jgi:hypothetical protein